jgi:RNA polymerase sigma-70 factor (ECF subfamily)
MTRLRSLPPAPEVTALVDGARRGEPAAFRELFRLHHARVHRVVYRLVGPSADLDDLVQTVFVEGFRSLPAFRGDALFSTWLGRIAVRVTMRAVKRPRLATTPLEASADAEHGGAGPEQTAADREGLRRLDEMLAALRPKRRAAFVLHVLEGYSMEEISVMVGASVAAVKVRLHDARREIERRAARDPWFAEWLGADGVGEGTS